LTYVLLLIDLYLSIEKYFILTLIAIIPRSYRVWSSECSRQCGDRSGINSLVVKMLPSPIVGRSIIIIILLLLNYRLYN